MSANGGSGLPALVNDLDPAEPSLLCGGVFVRTYEVASNIDRIGSDIV